ncbi:MAG: oxidoreductase [Rhodococcus sp. (in: high G+C Gram-positive bacteria)]|nr:MAG: oxidoreductase [Rhodococcus sp. (in: high G+C Gram-positive bacteria)]
MSWCWRSAGKPAHAPRAGDPVLRATGRRGRCPARPPTAEACRSSGAWLRLTPVASRTRAFRECRGPRSVPRRGRRRARAR